MHILFVTTKCFEGTADYTTQGLERLRFFLARNAIQCSMCNQNKAEIETFLNRTEKGDFDIISFSPSHFYLPDEIQTIEKFNKSRKKANKEIPLISGGHEPTLNSKVWLENGIELIFKGFAEDTLLEFINNFQHDGLETAIKKARGVKYLDKDNNLIEIPMPKLTQEDFERFSYTNILNSDYDYLTSWEKIRKEIPHDLKFGNYEYRVRCLHLFTSSHCPGGCGFCYAQQFYKYSYPDFKTVRVDAEHLFHMVSELTRRYQPDAIQFTEDNFFAMSTAGVQRASDFCKKIITAKENGTFPEHITFHVQARINEMYTNKVLNHELIDLLAKAGFKTLSMGIDNFVDRLRVTPMMNKSREMNKERCMKGLDALLAKGISPRINIILGVPETTLQDIRENCLLSLEYAKKGAELGTVTRVIAFPTSPATLSNKYEVNYKEWVNPANNRTIKYNGIFSLNNPEIEKVFQYHDEHYESYLEKYRENWPIKMLTPMYIGLVRILCIADGMKDHELMKNVEDFLNYYIAEIRNTVNQEC